MSLVDSMFSTDNTQLRFQIFTMDYLTSEKDDITKEAYTALNFTCLNEFGKKNQRNVAYEPLENGEFTSDSFQGSPYTIDLIASYTPFITSRSQTAQNLRKELADVVDKLNNYSKSTTLLLIYNYYPVIEVCSNLALTKFSYKLTAERNGLVCNMTFQEVRVVSAEYAAYNQQALANPESQPTYDGGTRVTNLEPDGEIMIKDNPAA